MNFSFLRLSFFFYLKNLFDFPLNKPQKKAIKCAIDFFDGDRIRAMEWMVSPVKSLGDQRPLNVAKTEQGSREVEALFHRIEHGVFS